jgi:hypothetical protein
MSESTPNRCPECHSPLKISVMRSSRSEDLVLECPVCGYTAFASAGLPPTVRQLLTELFDQVSKLQPFNLFKVLKDPRHSVTDKIVTLVAKLGATVMDYRTLLMLVAFFATLIGRRSLGVLVGSVVMACMVLYRDVVRKRVEGEQEEDEA